MKTRNIISEPWVSDPTRTINMIKQSNENVVVKPLQSVTHTTTSYVPTRLKHVTSEKSKGLNELAKETYEISASKGFHDRDHEFSDRGFPRRIALIHAELSEALEADREDLMDKHLPHRKGIEVELADAIIRILDCAATEGMDIEGAVREKMAYNKTRPYKHGGRKY